jgi:hypothetical protein
LNSPQNLEFCRLRENRSKFGCAATLSLHEGVNKTQTVWDTHDLRRHTCSLPELGGRRTYMPRPHPLEFITSSKYVTGLGLNAPDENNSKLPQGFGGWQPQEAS